uniref:Uncharacterized protein n=1 Tax=Gossypium raimondii TaxID=29730 RepID=A0A0D2UK89_GOSRA|nr:hypothetical protein B456_010G246200 [Gossypium raimondii]
MPVSFQILPLIFFMPGRIQRHYIVILSTVSVFGIFGLPWFISRQPLQPIPHSLFPSLNSTLAIDSQSYGSQAVQSVVSRAARKQCNQ